MCRGFFLFVPPTMGRAARHKKFCPDLLIENAAANDFTKELATFIRLKTATSHGWCYLSDHKQLKVSKSTLKRHLSSLIDLGLVTRTHHFSGKAKYILNTRAELIEKFGWNHSPVVLKTNDNNTTVKYAILHKLKEKYARQQERAVKSIRLTKKGKSSSQQAVLNMKNGDKSISYDEAKKRRTDKLNGHEFLLENVCFTYQWLGEKLNISKATAFRMSKFAEKRNFCKSKVITEVVAKMSYQDFLKEKPFFLEQFTHVFYKQGCVLRNIATSYEGRKYWSFGRMGIAKVL